VNRGTLHPSLGARKLHQKVSKIQLGSYGELHTSAHFCSCTSHIEQGVVILVSMVSNALAIYEQTQNV
jgi:hypothetical protein